jgi:hypothetical protein
MSMNALLPKAKVIAGGLGGALATLVVWLVQAYGGVEVPADVAAALATVFAFIVGYLTPEAPEVATSVEAAPDQ